MFRGVVLLCGLTACAGDDPFEYQVDFIRDTVNVTVDGMVNPPSIELFFSSYFVARASSVSVTVERDQQTTSREIAPGECSLLVENYGLGIMQLENVTYRVGPMVSDMSLASVTCIGTDSGVTIVK